MGKYATDFEKYQNIPIIIHHFTIFVKSKRKYGYFLGILQLYWQIFSVFSIRRAAREPPLQSFYFYIFLFSIAFDQGCFSGYNLDMPQKKKKTKLAVFDIDGTVFRSSLLVELINGLVDDHVFPLSARAEMEEDYLSWVNRTGEYEQYIQKVINIHLKYIKGCRQRDVESVAERVVNFQCKRLYRFTRDLLARSKKDKRFLVCISGSPTYIVSKFAKAVGFRAFFGSEYEVKDGVFTGEVTNLDTFYKKAFVLQEFLRTHGVDADLEGSTAVGDTESDIPMLEVVGHPIAFNPNTKLAEYAQEKGWRVVVERKDVIYELDTFTILPHN